MVRNIFRKIKESLVSAPIFSVVVLASGITMAMGGGTGLVIGLVVLSVYFIFILGLDVFSKRAS
ncbi:hypothetical protein COB11_05260 [Candidatus Aerophobetes bacterium]|uniref:Uncharacterized protein n=1 Tax=Aerophobetes bacterium TaxID=2030807 RepID=A0A2A4YG99_UNCAE|nr:MAG: hypothetical protein COB11_06475 [Candidatus Aerophobetes bacterium]PCI93499.1 MAG: hypothetical protein COB11_05260 [Candidatus Aerophobetes bacterium]